MPVRIAIVEDDPVLRGHLADTIERVAGFDLVGIAATFEQGLRLLTRCDVLLLDLALPDGNGLNLIRQARTRGLQDLKIIVVTVFADVRNVVQVIEAGADGYLLKGGSLSECERAIRDVMAGGAPISPAVAGHILARVRHQAPTTPSPIANGHLTDKETEVLTELARGYSYKEVAVRLDISHHTVADHVKAIYRKLCVNSRSEAVFEAMQNGLIDLREQ